MKDEYKDFLTRYFNYGTIFSKNEKELIALNYEFIKFYEVIYKARGVKFPEDSHVKPENTGGWMVHAMYLSLGLKYDLRDELKKVKSPVLVIHGEKDIMPSIASKEYADLFQEGELKVLSAVSHFPFIENPNGFAALVKEFLK